MYFCPTCNETEEEDLPGLTSLHHIYTEPPTHHRADQHVPDPEGFPVTEKS